MNSCIYFNITVVLYVLIATEVGIIRIYSDGYRKLTGQQRKATYLCFQALFDPTVDLKV